MSKVIDHISNQSILDTQLFEHECKASLNKKTKGKASITARRELEAYLDYKDLTGENLSLQEWRTL